MSKTEHAHVNSRKLSDLAEEALSDFKRICSALGSQSLNRQGFYRLLDSIGYTGNDKKELFDHLLDICSIESGSKGLFNLQ